MRRGGEREKGAINDVCVFSKAHFAVQKQEHEARKANILPWEWWR